jgi:hypothetical protein
MPDRMSQVGGRVTRLGWFVAVISIWFIVWTIAAMDLSEKICTAAAGPRGTGLLWVNFSQQLAAAVLLSFTGITLVYLGRLMRLSAAG